MNENNEVKLVKYKPKGYVVKRGRRSGSGVLGEKTVVRRVPLSFVPILDEMLLNWVPMSSNLQSEILLIMQELPDFVSSNSCFLDDK
ncbi:MAG: hypothetical protein LBE13_08180 [Bacteroidales bacterium]|jgi:hypothetical protein|nr:hypothetical protein [Bacteroidales bacterium]